VTLSLAGGASYCLAWKIFSLSIASLLAVLPLVQVRPINDGHERCLTEDPERPTSRYI
jgi:hypothetical protein